MTLLSNAFEETTSATAVSFSVLNADTTFGNYGKPNAIVRPVRRMESIDEPQQQDHRRPVGGNSGGSEMTAALLDTAETMASNNMDIFANQLDMKLKGLHHTDKKNSSKNVIILIFFSTYDFLIFAVASDVFDSSLCVRV